MFEKKDLFLLIILGVDLEDSRKVCNTRGAVPVVGDPVVVVTRNIGAQEKLYELSGNIIQILIKSQVCSSYSKPKSWKNDGFSCHSRFVIIIVFIGKSRM